MVLPSRAESMLSIRSNRAAHCFQGNIAKDFRSRILEKNKPWVERLTMKSSIMEVWKLFRSCVSIHVFRWREKVFALLVQLKSAEITSEKDAANFKIQVIRPKVIE